MATSSISTDDIANLGKTPIRVRTDEGTVQERSTRDLIEADRYSCLRSALDDGAVPWGMRIARTQPGGTVSGRRTTRI